MAARVLEQIRSYLQELQIEFREVHHAETRTSEESAQARGEDLSVGGKALVMKIDEDFVLLVLSAAKKLDSKALKQHFGAKKSRFATAEELAQMTGLVPGSVPPFGAPILSFPLFADVSVTENAKIAFNAGSLTDSMIMSTADYLRAAKPEIFRFSE